MAGALRDRQGHRQGFTCAAYLLLWRVRPSPVLPFRLLFLFFFFALGEDRYPYLTAELMSTLQRLSRSETGLSTPGPRFVSEEGAQPHAVRHPPRVQ